MRESHFIDQNNKKWADIESELERESKDPEKLSRLFVELTDDLSYSRTYYKNRSVRVYLNQIAQRLFQDIYKNQSVGAQGFFKFWREDLPLAVFYSRRSFLISFLVFAFAVGVGIFSSIKNPGFCESILGEDYVNMTLENIENGDPMAVYKSHDELDGFLMITQNNIRVAFMSFVSGIIAAMGTILVLLYNGVMVGAFQYFFVEYGYFQESFLTIWQHGTLEISSIIISGAAGLTLGRGLLFPGTYSRMQAFRLSGMQSLKIMMGVIPILIMAGFIEGFFTRHTEVPDVLRLVVIILSLSFVLFYFGWYPRRVAAKYSSRSEEDYYDEVPLHQKYNWDITTIKTASEIFVHTFSLFSKQFLRLIFVVLIASFLSLIPVMIIGSGDLDLNGAYSILNFIFYFIILVICISFACMGVIAKPKTDKLPYKAFFSKNSIISVVFVSLLFSLVVNMSHSFGLLIGFILLPIFYLIVFISHQEKIPFYLSISKTFLYMKGSYEQILGVWFRIILIGVLSGFAVNFLLSEFIIGGLSSMIDFSTIDFDVEFYLTFFLYNVCVIFTIILMGFAYGALSDTLREKVTASFLKKKIKLIGQKKKLMGLIIETKDV